MFFVIPMCIGIAVFAREILSVVYFTNLEYITGGTALAILVIGMTFYSIYTMSSSVVANAPPSIP